MFLILLSQFICSLNKGSTSKHAKEAGKYGLTFDLSGVSQNIKILVYRDDQKDQGKVLQESREKAVSIEGNAPFNIFIYATIDQKCTEGFITQFPAVEDTDGSGYGSAMPITDANFATCPAADDPFKPAQGGDGEEPGGNIPDGQGEHSDVKNINILKFKSFDIMFVIDPAKIDNCNEVKNAVSKTRGLCNSIKEGDGQYVDCQALAKLNNMYCTYKDKVNAELGNLNGNVDFLIVSLDNDPTEPIDFNKMNGQKVVVLTSDSDGKATILDKINHIFNRPIRKTKPSSAKPKDARQLYVSLVGGIKEHVSFLYILPAKSGNNFNYKVTGSKLDVENLFLEESYLQEGSESIDVTYAYNGYNNGGSEMGKKFHTKQIITVVGTHDKLDINFLKDKIKYTDEKDKNYGNYELASYTESYGIISETINYHIKAPQTGANIKDLNITIANIYDTVYEFNAFWKNFLKDDGKKKVTLTSDPWPDGFTVPKITVTCDSSKFELVKDGLADKLKENAVQQESIKYEERGPGSSGKSKKKLSAGAIAGIVIACVVVVGAVVGVLVWYFAFHKKNSVGNSASESA